MTCAYAGLNGASNFGTNADNSFHVVEVEDLVGAIILRSTMAVGMLTPEACLNGLNVLMTWTSCRLRNSLDSTE